jgi:phospholipid-binding lipoprotein MlaA
MRTPLFAAFLFSSALPFALHAEDFPAAPALPPQSATTPTLDELAAEQDDFDDYAPVAVYDPMEWLNRRFFALNDLTYTYVLGPGTKAYETVITPPVNRAIGNFYHNVRFPVRFLNSLLQGKGGQASREVQKFTVNTLGGLGGFIRQSETVPSLADLPVEDFGQTLGVWGVPHGPYLVVPFFGGTSLRDGTGRVADTLVSPLGWEYIDLANREWTGELSWQVQTAITVTDNLALIPGILSRYEEFKGAALDPYLSVRDGIRRYRDSLTAR